MTSRQDMEAIVEAILFVATGPVSRGKLFEVFSEKERESAAEALESVLVRYRRRGALTDGRSCPAEGGFLRTR